MNSHNVYELSRSFYVAFDARLWKYCKEVDLKMFLSITLTLLNSSRSCDSFLQRHHPAKGIGVLLWRPVHNISLSGGFHYFGPNHYKLSGGPNLFCKLKFISKHNSSTSIDVWNGWHQILPVELVKRWKRCGSVTSNLLSVWPPSWRVWRAALLGNVMLMAPVEFLKNIFSEARPHFLDSCKPNITEEMCRTG